MGIQRITQDFRPYLENAIISAAHPSQNAVLRIQNIVIDGPSMVYHVYGKLARYKHSPSLVDGLTSTPTYSELGRATIRFLSDLSRIGANVINIFFDGALPISKRPVRLERLERSRSQLEVLRLAHPMLTLPTELSQDMNETEVSEALWSTRSAAPSGTTAPTPPFIVPAVIEHLRTSKWANCTRVVAGEAETFCVQAAVATGSAILSNDSDLVLFPAILERGIVVRFDSLAMNQEAGSSLIDAQVWRPKRIAEALALPDLTRFAWERSKDSTARFPSICTRSRGPIDTQEKKCLQNFEEQFTTLPSLIVEKLNLDLFDPRLAELACQLGGDEIHAHPNELQVTLPMLSEDATRDSSWAYGKTFRTVAYSLLAQASVTSVKDQASHAPAACEVFELQRKGQRIVQELNSTTSITDQMNAVNQWLLALLNTLPDPKNISTAVPTHAWIRAWAIQVTSRQREALGKQTYSRSLLEQYFGSLPLNRTQRRDDSSGWDLMHLHANVDAVISSLRMLLQAYSLYKKTKSTQIHKASNHMITLQGNLNALSQRVGNINIMETFIDISRVRQAMQLLPHRDRQKVLGPVNQQTKVASLPALPRSVRPPSNSTDSYQLQESRKTKKKRKVEAAKHQQSSDSANSGLKHNPFALLADW